MDELDDYGSFNTRYEGVGRIAYLPGEPVPVYFEVRQLADGRLLVACVSMGEIIRDSPHAIDGNLLSGEPFSTMWGKGIKEIYRSEGRVSKAHYIANMIRVRYAKDLEPDNRSIQLALHNFIPGANTDVSNNNLDIQLEGYNLIISPAGNYSKQSERLLRYGGNLRTCWVKAQMTDSQGNRPIMKASVQDVVTNMLNPISLALGTLVTCPQTITFDVNGNRNDVEHYSSHTLPFSKFIPIQGWDAPVKETVEAWFSPVRIQLLSDEDLIVCIRQHLDACSTELYLETRALTAATLLDVLAGRYATIWAPQSLSHEISFKRKLKRLLTDLSIEIDSRNLDTIIKARNSLVHAGCFVTSEDDKTYSEYQNLMLLGRSILLRLVGFPSILHEAIVS